MIEAQELLKFVENYERFERGLKESNLTTILEDHKSFLDNYGKLDATLQKILREESPYFNVFSILNIKHYEAKVHTPFLCNLLNPAESHGQGIIFFKHLLVNVLMICTEIDVISNVTVYEELSMRYGRLDIMIDYEVNDVQKTLVIENKIYHHDGEEQLLRYYKYLTELRRLKSEDYALVYLTIHKSKPTANSIPLLLYNSLCSTGNLFCIGYKDDVAPWLMACIGKVSSERVRGLLKQYIETINTL